MTAVRWPVGSGNHPPVYTTRGTAGNELWAYLRHGPILAGAIYLIARGDRHA